MGSVPEPLSMPNEIGSVAGTVSIALVVVVVQSHVAWKVALVSISELVANAPLAAPLCEPLFKNQNGMTVPHPLVVVAYEPPLWLVYQSSLIL
jgi:hypothetical protein